MSRFPILAAALLLALPAPASAQVANRSGNSSSGAADEAEIFTSALELISQLHMGEFSDSTLWSAALDGLIESLDDPYAAVFTPAEVEAFEEQNTGNYTGIGVTITELNDLVTVTAIFRGTPADEGGVQEGDVIVGVDDENTRDWTTQQVSDVIRGPRGTRVVVRVEREGYAQPLPIELERDEVHVSVLTEARLESGPAYITMDRVARDVARELDSILALHRDAPGIILDLRGNPGGYFDEALMISDLFLEPGQKLASLRGRVRNQADVVNQEYTDQMRARLPRMPVVVLVDEFSASASEIVAGALQDYDRALIVGQRSFGKGIVQTVVPLPHGRQLRLTTGTWHTPLGRSLHRPRAQDGRPLEEDQDTFPRVHTAAGRELLGTGGIFPDVEVQDDTLKLAERELLQGAAEAQVPLPLRVLEFGFSEAQALLQTDDPTPRIREEPYRAFIQSLVGEGIPAELLDDPVAQEYMRWRTRFAIADRLGEGYEGWEAEVRMERDPVLRTAVDLLREAGTQAGLYSAAAALRGESTNGQKEPSAR